MSELPKEILAIKQRFSIIGNAEAFITAIDRARKVAPFGSSVLIIGESGSGKEFFPKIIHENSTRKHNRYIAINCATIPEGTIDSELFGHEKGAFTGAIASRKGYFEEANGGTIFLDEVAELPMATQARLLRVLESGEYLKVGSSEVKKTDIRIVAATNKNLLQAIAENKFREDLYYRLSTVQINIPPLRERGKDIWLLTRKFTSDFANEYRTPMPKFTASAEQELQAYSWPGNVRQLRNIIGRISIFEAGRDVDGETIKRYLYENGQNLKPVVSSSATSSYEQEREIIFKWIMEAQQCLSEIQQQINELKGEKPDNENTAHKIMAIEEKTGENKFETYNNFTDPHTLDVIDVIEDTTVGDSQTTRKLKESERKAIIAALERNANNRKKAAQELGISERTLYRKITQYKLDK